MERKTGQKQTGKGKPSREDRLKSALKANLQRRKSQARQRAEAPLSDEEEGKGD